MQRYEGGQASLESLGCFMHLLNQFLAGVTFAISLLATVWGKSLDAGEGCWIVLGIYFWLETAIYFF